VRRCNEFLAEIIQQRPDRFSGFACLPLPDVDSSLNELSYALDELGLDGVVAFANANGVYLGDSRLEPVFQELERRKCVVYVHPNASPDPSAHSLGLPDNLIFHDGYKSRRRTNALHKSICPYAKRAVHLLSRWRIDTVHGGALRNHR
jgi:predicted TIM-barrel fold metal-dependent hydrolase